MGAALSIRPTTPADLGAVVSLLSKRDRHTLDPANVSSALCALNPAHLAGWIAFVDDRPAGLTTLYTRDQRWAGKGGVRAGYWSHLFVPEEFRRLMVYPQLVLAMMRGVRALGIDCIFTGTRRAHVAEGHVKLGFAKLGEYRMLFKPLRPFRLVARHKRLPLAALAAPADALYSAWLSLRRPSSRVAVRPGSAADAEIIVSLLNSSGTEPVRQNWTADSLRRRLARTIDGYDYHILIAERDGRPVGASIYRLTIRERVCAGVIMELCGPPDVSSALLAEAERNLLALGADTTLYLDSLGPTTSDLLRSTGHRASSETYNMLVWPKTLVSTGSAAASLANWRFSFLDHDAF